MATERDYFHDLAEDLVHGAEESYVADLSEEMLDLLEQGMASEDRWAVVAMRFREAVMGVWARHTGAVTSQCERAFTRALEREDEAIVSSLASEFSAPAGLTNRAANEVMEASRGLAEIISRQNVALADNLADTWWRVTADAVTRTQMGDDPRDVMEDAVSFLSKAGLETIDYRSGQKTSIDAAVRRHTVTQANQCRNDLLVRQCEAYEVDLVFTSAHWGCRPTHAEWQGKPFSLHGTVEVDGVTYRDLAEATGYGTVWGLCGANCRHRLTPYIPGLSKLPDTDFKAFEEKYHMTSEEYYRATQRQRALERQVRATKREIALGQERGLDMTEARYRLGAQQKRLREHCAMTGLPRDGERERAYGVREQPRALTAARDTRSWTAFTQSDEVRAAIKASDMTQADALSLIRGGLEESGTSLAAFSIMPAKSQEELLDDILKRRDSAPIYKASVAHQSRLTAMHLGIDPADVSLEGLDVLTSMRMASAAEHAAATLPNIGGMVKKLTTCLPGFEPPEITDNTYAWAYGKAGRIEVGLKLCGRRETLLGLLRSDVATGFHPQGCDKEEWVLYHELAHVIDAALGMSGQYGSDPKGNASGMVQGRILSGCGVGLGEVEAAVSEYATRNPSEWFAESIAEALCSPTPRPVAKATLEWAVYALGAI